MPIVRTLLLLALGASQPALAETLSTETGDPTAAADRPTRGASMGAIEGRFGAPTTRHSAVGEPPITRWDYPQFSVYFEHDRVLHAVLVRSTPAG